MEFLKKKSEEEKERILVVENNENICKTLSFIFKRKGCEVEIVGTGAEAIEKVQEEIFNVALLEIKLPDIEGAKLLSSLKEIQPKMDIIMITAHATLESSARALNEGASAFITKPLNMDDVLSKIKNIVEKQWLIEEKHRADMEIKRIYSELNQLFNIAVPLCLIDKNFNVIRINDSFSSFFGVRVKETVGEKCYNVVPSNFCNTENCSLNQILCGKERYEYEKVFKHNNKPNITCLVRAVPYRNTKGKIIGIIENYTDITVRKKVENDLKESEEKYKDAYDRANFYKDIFTHDINNILQNLSSSLELLSIYQKGPENEKNTSEIIELFEAQVKRALKLVSNVRKLSELEDHIIPIEKVEAYQLLNNAIDYLYQSYKSREIEIQLDFSGKVIYVNTNQLLLDAFENILINAVKFNTSPIVEILIKIYEKRKDNSNFIFFEFIDNGIGITDDAKGKIFTGGYRTSKKIKGLGLGLSLVKKIINSYGGQIWVENKVKGDYSKGSNFIIALPQSS